MVIEFYKYHGAGNDFIMIDDRLMTFPSNNYELIEKLCHRHFGIGADGLILLQNHHSSDFKMVYYNSDGKPSSMCGNGGRCIAQFALDLGILNSKKITFEAVDGIHQAEILNEGVMLKMADVQEIISNKNGSYILNTGSPHFVTFVDDVANVDVKTQGRVIRNSDMFREKGINVNFVQMLDKNTIKIRTYERGVEDETLACGTGVTAAAIVCGLVNQVERVGVHAQGGKLAVDFKKNEKHFSEIWLYGSAQFVFKGIVEI